MISADNRCADNSCVDGKAFGEVNPMNGLVRAICAIAVGLAALGLQGCGGGGGSNPPNPPSGQATFSVTPTALTFSATSSTSTAPAPQTVTGTVSNGGSLSGTLYIVVSPLTPTSPVGDIGSFIVNGNSGQATVTPRAPDVLGAGSHPGTITVRACMDDPTCATGELAGSPKTINVSYSIGASTPPNAVMPHVAVAGRSAEVVIRGAGLNNTTSVKFGSADAASFTIVSDTEVRATYPALAAGTHVVSLTPNTGAGGSIVAVAPVTYAQTTLPFPEQAAQGLTFLLYDAERQALLAGGRFFSPGSGAPEPNKVWRYTYAAGAWSGPTTIPIDNLADAEWSPDGSRLIASNRASVLELSPDVLSTLRTVPGPKLGGTTETLGSIAIENDGHALISWHGGFPAPDGVYYYAIASGTFVRMALTSLEQEPYAMTGTLDGSRAFGTVSAISPSQPILDYSASTGRRSFTVTSDQQYPFTVNANASRIIVHERHGFTPYGRVYPSDYAAPFTPMGILPGWQFTGDIDHSIRAVIVDREGKRAYVLYWSSELRTFDISQAPAGGGEFPELGTPIVLTIPDPVREWGPTTAITPDGNTLFFAGRDGVLVVPAPSPAN